MNVEQALHHTKESEDEGLRGLYPTAAQVLAAEVKDLREKLSAFSDREPCAWRYAVPVPGGTWTEHFSDSKPTPVGKISITALFDA